MRDLRNALNIELPRAKGAYLEDAPDRIWTEPGWVLEPKEDGTRESLQLGFMDSMLVGRNREGFLQGVEKAGKFMVHDHPLLTHMETATFDGTLLDGECTMHFTKDDENAPARRQICRFHRLADPFCPRRGHPASR